MPFTEEIKERFEGAAQDTARFERGLKKQGETKHAYRIRCVVCDEHLDCTCVMDVLEFLVKHKECAQKKKTDTEEEQDG